LLKVIIIISLLLICPSLAFASVTPTQHKCIYEKIYDADILTDTIAHLQGTLSEPTNETVMILGANHTAHEVENCLK